MEYGVPTGRNRMLGDQLGLVPGPNSRIRDRSAEGTCLVRGTTVADLRLHARFELQLIPRMRTFFGNRSRPAVEPAIGRDRMTSTSVVASSEHS